MIARAFALLVAGPFRFLVVAGGIAACVAAYVSLPVITENQSEPLAVAPSGSRAREHPRASRFVPRLRVRHGRRRTHRLDLVRGQLVPAMVSVFGRVGARPGAAYRAAKGRGFWVA